ncbi:MAG: hypothetical protein ACLT46_06960 [Hungatella sp.]
MKSRRENLRTFSAEVDKEKMEALEKKLSQKNQSKKEWLDSKIDEEISK